MSDQELIELVRQHPVLYNKRLIQYNDPALRLEAWEQIAEQLDNMPIEDIKYKWLKLRTCYTNALRRQQRRIKRGKSANNSIPWKFEDEMEFLSPHIRRNDDAENDGSEPEMNNTIWTQNVSKRRPVRDKELHYSEESDSPSPERTTTPNETFLECYDDKNELQQIINSSHNLKPKRVSEMVHPLDGVDHFFLSMSKRLKKLPKIEQSEIRFQLHKLIHDAEIKILKDKLCVDL